MAHITGGGIPGNLNRILPDNVDAIIEKKAWKPSPLFKFIQETGSIADEDMFPAFNMGIGYIIVVSSDTADKVCDALRSGGETPYIIGKIVQGEKKVILKD